MIKWCMINFSLRYFFFIMSHHLLLFFYQKKMYWNVLSLCQQALQSTVYALSAAFGFSLCPVTPTQGGGGHGETWALPSWLISARPTDCNTPKRLASLSLWVSCWTAVQGHIFSVKQTCKVARHIQGEREIRVTQYLFCKVCLKKKNCITSHLMIVQRRVDT